MLIEELIKNYDIIGYPRLVRLNPNIPWKTRGNGAISFQLGYGKNNKIKIGEINGKSIFSYADLKRDIDKLDYKKIKKIVEKKINENAIISDINTNPGYVLIKDQLNEKIYVNAVTRIVLLDEILDILKNSNAEFNGYKNKRGLIGAVSSIAWNSNFDSTYEIITYRDKNKWKTKRFVDDKSVISLDKNCKSTFDNYDYINNHNRIMPNSPCPILFGIRGDDSIELINCLSFINSEKIHSWLIYITNQGTDDHLCKKTIDDIKPYESVIVRGIVIRDPYTIQGGHVFFRIKDEKGEIDCAAYEPTKNFKDIIRDIVVGDVVEVYGGVRKDPLTINIEKIKIVSLVKIKKKIENPVCKKCNKHMKSVGKNQGFRCKICGDKSNTAIIKDFNRKLETKFYEVPVCARRHLSKPLIRIKKII